MGAACLMVRAVTYTVMENSSATHAGLAEEKKDI